MVWKITAAEVRRLLKQGNLPQAESYCRIALENQPSNPLAFQVLGVIARNINQLEFAETYFRKASELDPAWDQPRDQLRQTIELRQQNTEHRAATKDTGFLLIKAWGYGFWSDVDHVLGQLLLAEMTGRVPVIHWGANSLFGDGTDETDAFETYFEPVSAYASADLARPDYSFFPPKWDRANLARAEVNKWHGRHARMSALYFLGREETVLVSDFHTAVLQLLPWVRADHHLYGRSIEDVYRYLIGKYLRAKPEIMQQVEKFRQTRLEAKPYIAVHVRGSDKAVEVKNLDDINGQYHAIIDRLIAERGYRRIFLLTDDQRVLRTFRARYGDRVLTTNCRRTDNAVGVHYHRVSDRHRLGIEVMVDTYLAARAGYFLGNGLSNVSLIVPYLTNRRAEDYCLIGGHMHHSREFFLKLHDW